jgi:hypothetical protein
VGFQECLNPLIVGIGGGRIVPLDRMNTLEDTRRIPPSLIFEAVADKEIWNWHAFFWMHGYCNTNVLQVHLSSPSQQMTNCHWWSLKQMNSSTPQTTMESIRSGNISKASA